MMKNLKFAIQLITTCLLTSSCITQAPKLNYHELITAAIALEMDIDLHDNHRLYVESAKWIGVPYRYGGTTMKGVDCSGFTYNIYRKVYRKRIQRNSESQRRQCQRIYKRNLKEGHLVFFHNGKDRRKASHVGIYLKNGKFIHASTSSGVIVSSLNENYYQKRWLQGGKLF